MSRMRVDRCRLWGGTRRDAAGRGETRREAWGSHGRQGANGAQQTMRRATTFASSPGIPGMPLMPAWDAVPHGEHPAVQELKTHRKLANAAAEPPRF